MSNRIELSALERKRDRVLHISSRSMSEFAGVGFAARGEGLAQFVRLLAVEIGAQQEVVRQAGEAADAAVAGAEGGLDRGQGEGAALGDFEGHGAGRGGELLVGDDLV